MPDTRPLLVDVGTATRGTVRSNVMVVTSCHLWVFWVPLCMKLSSQFLFSHMFWCRLEQLWCVPAGWAGLHPPKPPGREHFGDIRKCWRRHNANVTHIKYFSVAGAGLFIIKPKQLHYGWFAVIFVWHVWGIESSSFQSVIVALSRLCCQHPNIPDV